MSGRRRLSAVVIATVIAAIGVFAPSAGAAVTFTASGTEVTITGDAADNTIDVICVAGIVAVDDPPLLTGVACSDLSKLTVFGDEGRDDINLLAVTPAEGFTNPVLDGSLIITGNDDADRLNSSQRLLTFSYGGAAIDRLFGHKANDSMSGGRGADLVKGNGGSDFIKGKSGGDDLSGGKGIDFILGGTGRDAISGGKRIDCLRGGAGDDLIQSGPGRDSVGGGPGDDEINEGPPPGDIISEARCSAAAL